MHVWVQSESTILTEALAHLQHPPDKLTALLLLSYIYLRLLI